MIKGILKKIRYELSFNNTNYYLRISDKVSKKYYQAKLVKKLSSLSPINAGDNDTDLTVAILSNKKNFYESVAALYSFCYWNKKVNIHYHEDGTLTEREFVFLRRIFPGISIFLRAEQNREINNYLLSKGLTHCAKLREHFIFSLRTFDMIVRKNTPYLIQIDSDVLFFSRPNEVLEIVEKGELNGCYNQDVSDAYTFDRQTAIKYIQKPITGQFNAGLFLHNLTEDFFDFAENILKNEPGSTSSWHLEQTLFAMYVTLSGKYLELPLYYDLARRERNKGAKIVSEHYVHNTGYDLHKDFIYKIYPLLKNKA